MSRSLLVVALTLFLPFTLLGQDTPGYKTSSPSPVFLDRAVASPAELAAAPSTWQHLALLEPDQRANAALQIDLPSNATRAAQDLAQKTMTAWNTGNYDAALNSYADLAAMDDMRQAETVIQWRSSTPAPLEKILAANVRLGARDSITNVDIVCDASNAHLFAVASFQGDGSGGSYDLYRSMNDGTTWSVVSTNIMNSENTARIAFVNSRVHILYRLNNGAELRWRRYDSTGSVVSFPGGNYVSLAGPGASPTVVEVSPFTNNMYYNNRLYYMTILSDHTARMYWAHADSAFFTPYSSTTGVQRGISGIWASYTGGNKYFASYIDTTGQVCIDSISSTKWTRKLTTTGGGSTTSMGYYKDTIVCAYENGSICSYRISYNAGRTWSIGGVDDAGVTHELPAISMEKGQGMAIIYRFYTPTREGRIITRQYKGPGSWSAPVAFADHEPYFTPMAITAMGGGRWGIVYTAWTTPRVAYFALVQGTLVNVEAPQQTVPDQFALQQNYPNPFNPSTAIRFELPRSSRVTLKVYNMIGQEVALLLDEERAAGVHEVKFDARNLASGLYIYKITADHFVSAKKMMLLK